MFRLRTRSEKNAAQNPTTWANLCILQMATRISVYQRLLFTKLSLFVSSCIFKCWKHSTNFWVFVKMAKTGIIVRSTPLFSCPFHILSHGKKESTKHNKNAALPSSSSFSSFFMVRDRTIFAGTFCFCQKAFDRFIFCCVAQFQIVRLLCWHIFCVARAFNNHTLSTRRNAWVGFLMHHTHLGQKMWE